MKNTKPVKNHKYVTWDCKDDPGVLEVFDDLIKAVNALLTEKKLKVYVEKDPLCKYSDTYGYSLSLKELTGPEVKKNVKKIYGDD